MLSYNAGSKNQKNGLLQIEINCLMFEFIKICLYISVLFSSLTSWNETAARKITFYNLILQKLFLLTFVNFFFFWKSNCSFTEKFNNSVTATTSQRDDNNRVNFHTVIFINYDKTIQLQYISLGIFF